MTKYDAIIFDIDQTLVDTRNLQVHRDTQQWSLVYKNLPSSVEFISLSTEVTNLLRVCNIGVVTHGQRKYFQQLMNSWEFGFLFLSSPSICGNEGVYKPSPTSLLKCANYLNVLPERCIYVGDSSHDVLAAKAANMLSVGVSWFLTASEQAELLSVHPDIHFEFVDSFERFLLQEFR